MRDFQAIPYRQTDAYKRALAAANAQREKISHRVGTLWPSENGQSGRPRGLLCLFCNTIEGKIRAIGLDPIEFGQRLQSYLNRSTEGGGSDA